MKRLRGAQDKDDEPLVFKHMKRTKVEDQLKISEDEEDLEKEIPEYVQRKEWRMEGLSDLYAQVWEEVYDEDHARIFHDHHRMRQEKARA